MLKVTLHVDGLNELIDKYSNLDKWLEDKCDELAMRLAEHGAKVAKIHYSTAPYAGKNDVEVTVDPEGKGKAVIKATGQSVLFIEFGTGITKPYNAADARHDLVDSSMIVNHGQYELQRASSPKGWVYEGFPGNNPPSDTFYMSDKSADEGIPLTHTMGSDATPGMYFGKKSIERHFEEIVREVFDLD